MTRIAITKTDAMVMGFLRALLALVRDDSQEAWHRLINRAVPLRERVEAWQLNLCAPHGGRSASPGHGQLWDADSVINRLVNVEIVAEAASVGIQPADTWYSRTAEVVSRRMDRLLRGA